MPDPAIAAARHAVAAAASVLAHQGVRSPAAATAVEHAHHTTAAAYDRGHRVTDIHPRITGPRRST